MPPSLTERQMKYGASSILTMPSTCKVFKILVLFDVFYIEGFFKILIYELSQTVFCGCSLLQQAEGVIS